MQLFTQIGDLGPKWFHASLRTLVLLTQHAKLQSKEIASLLDEDASYIRKCSLFSSNKVS